MRHDGEVRVINVERNGAGMSFRSVVRASGQLARCALDRHSVAVISHPFNPWFSLFALFARDIEVYDDGTAYYNETKIPGGALSIVYRFLTFRHFRWREVAPPHDDYGTMLRTSRASALHAMYPHALEGVPYEVVPIDLTLAFPRVVPDENATMVRLFLDTGCDVAPQGTAAEAAVRALEGLASVQPGATFYYRPHPTGPSEVSQLLAKCSWAMLMDGALEDVVREYNVVEVISFSSSGALSIKNMFPEARVINMKRIGSPSAPRALERVFSGLRADEVAY